MRPLAFFVFLSILVWAASGQSSMQSDEPSVERSTLDGVFSFSQARTGERVFRVTCSECHEPDQFTGEEFLENLKSWEFESLYDLVEHLELTMPADNAGGLPRREYVEIVAYILQLNGFPRGEQPLPEDDETLKQVMIRHPTDEN